MKMIVVPPLGQLAHRAVEARRSPTEESRAVGSSMMMNWAPRARARRISTFCWSAADSSRARRAARHDDAGVLRQLREALLQRAAP